jgi:hypothetical protein
MKWEAFALPPRRTSFRYSDGEVEPSVANDLTPSVHMVMGQFGGTLTFWLTPDQADELAAKLADAAAAARAMPVEERIYEVGKTKGELEKAALEKAGAR